MTDSAPGPSRRRELGRLESAAGDRPSNPSADDATGIAVSNSSDTGASEAVQSPGDADDRRPIDVCYLTNHLAPDGAPTVLESLVQEISSREISFTVCFFGSDDTLAASLEDAGARVVDFGAVTEYPQFDPRSLPSMLSFFATESFDILHCHLPYAQTLGRLVGRVTGADHVVSTQHNVPSNYHPVERVAERVTRRLDSATIAVSGGVESSFTGTRPTAPTESGKWGTIQNGIDVAAFKRAVDAADADSVRARWGVEDADPLFVNIARYQPQKGQETLIAAMEAVAESVPSAHLLIVGWGPLEADLRSSVRDRGLTDAVTVTGRVPEIHGYYAAADTFVLSSNFEGLPVSLLEAMSAACPVVATDIPGVREVVVDGDTGTLVPPGNPEALAEGLISMAEADGRAQFGAAGLGRVREQFSIERMAAEHVELYRNLVDA